MNIRHAAAVDDMKKASLAGLGIGVPEGGRDLGVGAGRGGGRGGITGVSQPAGQAYLGSPWATGRFSLCTARPARHLNSSLTASYPGLGVLNPGLTTPKESLTLPAHVHMHARVSGNAYICPFVQMRRHSPMQPKHGALLLLPPQCCRTDRDPYYMRRRAFPRWPTTQQQQQSPVGPRRWQRGKFWIWGCIPPCARYGFSGTTLARPLRAPPPSLPGTPGPTFTDPGGPCSNLFLSESGRPAAPIGNVSVMTCRPVRCTDPRVTSRTTQSSSTGVVSSLRRRGRGPVGAHTGATSLLASPFS